MVTLIFSYLCFCFKKIFEVLSSKYSLTKISAMSWHLRIKTRTRVGGWGTGRSWWQWSTSWNTDAVEERHVEKLQQGRTNDWQILSIRRITSEGKSRSCWQVKSSEKGAEPNLLFNEVLSRSPREVNNDCNERLARVWKKKKKKAKLSDTW